MCKKCRADNPHGIISPSFSVGTVSPCLHHRSVSGSGWKCQDTMKCLQNGIRYVGFSTSSNYFLAGPSLCNERHAYNESGIATISSDFAIFLASTIVFCGNPLLPSTTLSTNPLHILLPDLMLAQTACLVA